MAATAGSYSGRAPMKTPYHQFTSKDKQWHCAIASPGSLVGFACDRVIGEMS